MNIQELATYNLAEQAQFKLTLNPVIWNTHEHLQTRVRNQILFGAEAYCAELGIAESQVVDVVVSGAMAAYNYTATSDIDVIIVADLNPDPTFREFFNENRYQYNRQHAVKVGAHHIKFYVQPAEEKITSRGSYSVLSESWLQVAQRRLTEDTDTVLGLKRAEQAAQPAPSKPVVKKPVIKEHKPTIYGYGEDCISKNNLEQFKIFINNFAKEFKLPNIIKDHYIIEHTSKTELFISEYNSKVKEKITKYVWDLPEKLKKYNLTTEDVYKSSDLYKQFVKYTLVRELPLNRVKLKESLDNVKNVVDKITKSLGITTQSPNVNDKVDIVDLTVNKISHRIEIAVKYNETITEFKGNMYSTASGEIGHLGKHPGIDGVDTTTYFAPANTIKTNKTMLSLNSTHKDDGLEIDGWKINYNTDSITQKLSHIFKEHFNKLINEVALTPDGTSATTSQFTNEQAPPSTEETLIDFVKFCSDQLELKNEPVLKIRKDPEWSRRNKTFGRFNGATHQLEVSVAGRHMMDVLRTIAHELTHQHQHEREDVPADAGDTGSEYENEANARAGILMRDYGQEHPHLFADSDELNENWKKWAAGGLAAAALAGGVAPAHGQSIQQGLGAVKNIGTMVNTLKNTNIPAMLQGEAQAALYNFIAANGGNPNSQNQSSLYHWQKAYQQDRAEQAQGINSGSAASGQYTQQAADPQTAAQGDMYAQQLQQHTARQSANEASGYIPTKKQARDPRFSTALTQDIRPGTLGKVANALRLNTDSQGRPQEANPNGTVKRLKEELEFIKLTEAADAEIDNLTVDQMLDYANRMHVAGFQNGVMIKKHPRWKLTTLPIGVLQLKDPGRKDIDNDHVQSITELDLETKPIIVGSRGVIIDGNHRARRAFELGIDSLPAFVPKL